MTRITDKTVARMDNRIGDQGAILINVLLIAMLMSIFMAASLALLNAPVNAFNNGLNTAQAYYNAKAGLIVGEDQIASTIKSSTTLSGITNTYPYTSPASSASAPWSISTSITGENTTVIKGPPTTTTTILTFTITSTGVAGNETSPPLSTQETATVTY